MVLRIGIDTWSVRRPNYHLARTVASSIDEVELIAAPRVPLERVPFLRKRFAGSYIGVNRRVDLFHLWNRVAETPVRSPWGVTFESRLPRLIPDSPKAMEILLLDRISHDDCKFAIALSAYARDRFLEAQRAISPEVENKVHVLGPRISTIGGMDARANLDHTTDVLRLLFVGRDFFRKGGESLLRAVERYGDALNFSATIVSPVSGNDYATRAIDMAHVEDVRRRLGSNNRIVWQSELTHSDVEASMRSHHIFVMPTFADTYGYAFLEALGQGLPVFGSNVQAGPEIVADSRGWRVQYPLKSQSRESQLDGADYPAYSSAMDSVADSLANTVMETRKDTRQWSVRSENAIEYVRTNHGDARDSKLALIYERATGQQLG